MLHALRGGPCVEAAAALERVRDGVAPCARESADAACALLTRPRLQEATAHGLLPRRYSPAAPLGPDGELPTVAQSYAEARGARGAACF